MKSWSIGALGVAGLSIVLAAACTKKDPDTVKAQPGESLAGMPRAEFNRLALARALPLFWHEDRNQNGALEPEELDVIWGLDESTRNTWVLDRQFTPAFHQAWADLKRQQGVSLPEPDAQEKLRQDLLRQELAAGYFTVLASDFTQASPEDRALVSYIMRAAALVEQIYQKQVGSFGLSQRIPAADTQSRMAFFLNHGPWCSAPATQNDKNCHALRDRPERRSGLYPLSIQSDPAFCKKLAARPGSAELLSPFTVVSENEARDLEAVPYATAWPSEMAEVAAILQKAAKVLPPSEQAFHAYLMAAAQAFLDNNWYAADETWSRMNAENSKWYLRIGPDETYFEPCSEKAGFHVSFARIDSASLRWQKLLEPVKGEMEQTLARYAGKPYLARAVSFHLPDFIEIILNSGDARSARGATIGQSLPNWGPVANEGRGRTVVMTNFYNDPESKRILRAQVESVFCRDVMPLYTDDADPQLLSTVLHEAAHNLGPSHEYAVDARTDTQIFGGPLASVMEELKAQTSALFFIDWLAAKGLVAQDLAKRAHVRDLAWAMGHISRGFYDADGKPKPYSQLAAIQVGYFLKQGAVVWRATETPANGTDQGCLGLLPDKLPPAVDSLTNLVLGLKARGDLERAKALQSEFVDQGGDWQKVVSVITERWLRWPRASFLYAVRL